MIIEWYHWVFGILGAIIGGGLIASIWYLIYHATFKWKLRKYKLPKDKSKLQEWINQNKDLTKDVGKTTQMDIKEVEIDDKRRREEYRQLEQLRHFAKGSGELEMVKLVTKQDGVQSPNDSSAFENKRTVELD